ncbi:MAG: M3 family oligoendopeptidase [Saccharofermentans sp.]|nr:M3 family oligoendopeptidase [Saccharofermentans sp.]
MENTANSSVPDFKELNYTRPDLDKFTETVRNVRLRLMTAKTIEAADEALGEYEIAISNFDTQYALCQILHDLDTSNEFYNTELEFFDEASARVQELSSAVLSGLLTAPCADGLKVKYGHMIFRKAKNQREIISSEVIDDLTEESKLENEYSQKQSEAEIAFGKKTLNLSLIQPYLQSTDRSVRRNAHIALDAYYMSRKDDYDRIYDELVKVRTTAAQKLGYSSFTDLGYKRMERYDYTKEDVASFRDNIKKYIVPLTVQIRKLQQERLGLDKLMFHDLPCLFKEGNPAPVVSKETYKDAAGKFFRTMFGASPSFFDILSDHGYTDLLSRPDKSTGGYCMYLEDYCIPFIFMNGNGTFDDVATVIHEGGHAYAALAGAESSPFVECLSPTLETCEIHSTSMEYMSYPFMDIFYGKHADQYCELHMTDGLLFLPYGCMVDEFQHIIYDNPNMTPDERHEIWRMLEQTYQPFTNYDENDTPFHAMGGAWMKKDHIFTTPFYYIDYCLSQICALELWDESRTDLKVALEKYNNLCQLGGSDTFLNLIKRAGIESPFNVDVIKLLAFKCSDFLNL